MLGEVLGVERRRRWSDDEKLEILLEVGVGGASVTQVAQRHELTRSQIYGWRRDLKKKAFGRQIAGRCSCRSISVPAAPIAEVICGWWARTSASCSTSSPRR